MLASFRFANFEFRIDADFIFIPPHIFSKIYRILYKITNNSWQQSL